MDYRAKRTVRKRGSRYSLSTVDCQQHQDLTFSYYVRGLCTLLWNCRSTITLTIQLTAIPMCPAQGCQAVCVTSNVGDKFHAPHNLLCGRQFVNSVRGRSYSACTKLRFSGFSPRDHTRRGSLHPPFSSFHGVAFLMIVINFSRHIVKREKTYYPHRLLLSDW